jgi:hypothetical protein
MMKKSFALPRSFALSFMDKLCVDFERPMSLSFHFEHPDHPLPQVDLRIFVDNTSPHYRDGQDLELSHWNPNNTPERFLADTSTEIVLNYLTLVGAPKDGLVINNHLDVDGILSVFALLNQDLALLHRDLLLGAAETGDFWAFSGKASLSLYQSLVTLCDSQKSKGEDEASIYESCFQVLPELIEKAYHKSEIGLVNKSVNLVREGSIERHCWHRRFVSFVILEAVHKGDLERALHVTEFNASLNDGCLLRGVVRNRRDADRVQLVSVEGEKGWYHDLYYPGYMWAETIDRWRAPGFWEGESSNTWYFRYAPLDEALAIIRSLEQSKGTWQTVDELTPFEDGLGRGFPVVASFLDENDLPAESSIAPKDLARLLCEAYTYDKTSRL